MGQGEMALLSDRAYQLMADLLNLVEAGEEWPQGMQHGRVAYLEKEPGECEDALKFRPLVLLPALYRRWASARLEALREWTARWTLTSIYAGAEPQGAAEATYHIGTQIELAELTGKHMAG